MLAVKDQTGQILFLGQLHLLAEVAAVQVVLPPLDRILRLEQVAGPVEVVPPIAMELNQEVPEQQIKVIMVGLQSFRIMLALVEVVLAQSAHQTQVLPGDLAAMEFLRQ